MTKNNPPLSNDQAKTAASLCSIDIFPSPSNLRIKDFQVMDLIIDHGQEIPNLAAFLKYVRFLLQRSAGQINKPQFHSVSTICEVVGLEKRYYLRLEKQWVEQGWLMKIERDNRSTSFRLLGSKFDELRYVKIDLPSDEDSGALDHSPSGVTVHSPSGVTVHSPSGVTVHSPGGAIVHSNPNSLKQSDLKPHNDDEEETSSLGKSKQKWLYELKPSEVVNVLVRQGNLRAAKNGYVDKIEKWNALIRALWIGKLHHEIEHDLEALKNYGKTLPDDLAKILMLLEALRAPKPEIKPSEPAFESDADYEQYLASVRDDFPF